MTFNISDLIGQQTTGKIDLAADNRIDRTDTLTVLWYQWIVEQTGPLSPNIANPTSFASSLIKDELITQSRALDISNHISSFTYTKTMAGAAGEWEMILENSIEWDRYLLPGQWLCAFMSDNNVLHSLPQEQAQRPDNFTNSVLASATNSFLGKALEGAIGRIEFTTPPPGIPEHFSFPGALTPIQNLCRMMGVITRVGISSNVDENGTEIVQYRVSGKDFGIVFEDTRLWFNFISLEETLFTKAIELLLPTEDRLDNWMKMWFNIFFNPSLLKGFSGTNAEAINKAKDISEAMRQWVIPFQMASDFGMIPLGFPGNFHLGAFADIQLEFDQSPFGVAGHQTQITQDMGSAWDKLKELSQPECHELFTELSHTGTPRIFFRPIPFARLANLSAYPTLYAGGVKTFDELADTLPSLGGLLAAGLLDGGSVSDVILSIVKSQLDRLSSGKRLVHRVDVHPSEIEVFDIGPGFHERYSQFIVDVSTLSTQKFSALNIFQSSQFAFPIRDQINVLRNGFRPMHLELKMYQTSLLPNFNGSLPAIKNQNPDVLFMAQINHLLADYHLNAKNYYSGTMTIAGKNEIRLGKTLVVDPSSNKLGNRVFYIEGYTDHFQVDANGTGTWTQTLQLTRGQKMSDLSIFGDLEAFLNDLSGSLQKTGTFHVDPSRSS